jgi:hypothetical protein
MVNTNVLSLCNRVLVEKILKTPPPSMQPDGSQKPVTSTNPVLDENIHIPFF